jgi:hypothetical protein
MFGRIFGRGKDDQDQAVCAECGRTLLAGEWTQTVVDEHGDERLICSLCGQAYAGLNEPVAAAPTPANNGRVRETRSEARYEEPSEPAPVAEPEELDTHAESDAFWLALKEKDAQIEGLKAELARAEAERQELAGRFARLGTAGAAGTAEPEPGSLTGDSSEPGERTWGETPAEFAAEMAALREAEATPAETQAVREEPAGEPLEEVPAAEAGLDETAPVEEVVVEEIAVGAAGQPAAIDEPAVEAAIVVAAAEAGAEAPADEAPAVPSTVFEDTQPIDVVSDEMLAAEDDEDASTGEIAAAEAAAAVAAGGGALPGEPPAEERAAPSAAEAEAAAASLTLLQRGVDLLNVSRVPHKIAETNEELGLPHVHVGFDGETVAVTFMWTMGWYRFHVDLDSGDVGMSDRGYEELALPPNAGVRADGTVQLAPAQISRAAAQRAQTAPETATPPAQAAAPTGPAAEPETPRQAAQKPPEFLSKSLLGQRSDDETASWEQTKARDFDWDR